MICLAVFIDALVVPRRHAVPFFGIRSAAGLWLLCLLMTILFGILLTLCGNLSFAVVLALAILLLFVFASNAKYAILGEALLFSDLALLGALFRHPQFYFSAIGLWQRIAISIVAVVLIAVFGWQFDPEPISHAVGLAVAFAAAVVLFVTVRSKPYRKLVSKPDHHADIERHGLLPALLLYWLRWRESCDPSPYELLERKTSPIAPEAPELIVIVQCESFADPVELFEDVQLDLPGLSRARACAWQWGRLQVSGFGAYTMRTEYGVLFGRDEACLGYRRYDPFLTALGETSYAFPAQLNSAGWRSLFVHPHDMRFYGRDQIMPAAGFAELVGEDSFDTPPPGSGRYVCDEAVADKIVSLAQANPDPTLIYAVTMENHGPWAPSGLETGELPHEYLRLVRRSDAMLSNLLDEVAAMKRSTMLAFFGDHRPSIPGACTPGGARHTPFVIIRFDSQGRTLSGDDCQLELTPAELHHAMLNAVLGEPISSMDADRRE